MDPWDKVESEGFVLLPGLLTKTAVASFVEMAAPLFAENHSVRDIFGKQPGFRDLLQVPDLRPVLERVVGPGFFAVRSILFNKLPGTNWRVAWHQDLTIAVKHRMEVPGFTAWTEKAGIPHVQAPEPVLRGMVAVRVHLDDCGESNGPLKVIAGSHRSGKWTPESIRDSVKKERAVTCLARQGDVLLMRPLLLHASSPALEPSNRRVVHLEIAQADLPGGLEWYEKVR